jgi:hypothetical protein
MRLKLGEHEYVIRVRAVAYPHLQTLLRAFTENPPSADELKSAEENAVKLCVSPEPCDEHYDEVVAALVMRYSELMRKIPSMFRA